MRVYHQVTARSRRQQAHELSSVSHVSRTTSLSRTLVLGSSWAQIIYSGRRILLVVVLAMFFHLGPRLLGRSLAHIEALTILGHIRR
jgi:hypothetical protein